MRGAAAPFFGLLDAISGAGRTLWELRIVFRARMTWVMFAIIVLYLESAHILTSAQSAEVWRSLQISLSAMVCVAYARRAGRCFTVVGRWPERIELISLGIVLSWASVFCNGAWGVFWRLSGQPEWMVNNYLYQSWVMFNCIAAGLHILAPNLLGQGVPVLDRVRLGAAFGAAMALIAILAVARPDLRPYADILKEFVAERPSQSHMPAPFGHRLDATGGVGAMTRLAPGEP